MNFRKKSSIPTWPGLIVSIIIGIFTFAYTIKRAQVLFARIGPTVTSELALNTYTAQESINLEDAGFKIAFGVMDYSNRTVLQNENRVEWNVYLEERSNLEVVSTVPVATHKCTPGELDSFYEVTADNKAFLKELKDKEALYCLDPNHKIDVRG